MVDFVWLLWRDDSVLGVYENAHSAAEVAEAIVSQEHSGWQHSNSWRWIKTDGSVLRIERRLVG